MKRFVLRLSAFTTLVTLALIAIAYAQRARTGPDPQSAGATAANRDAGLDRASAAPSPDAESQAAAGNPAATASESADEPSGGRPVASGESAATEATTASTTTVRSQSDDEEEAGGAIRTDPFSTLRGSADEDEGAGEEGALASDELSDDFAPRAFDAGPASRLEPTEAPPEEEAYDFPAERSAPPSPAALETDPYDSAAGGQGLAGDDDAGPATSAAPRGAGRPGSPDLSGPQSPTVTVEKSAPDEIQIGKEATFEIRVRNDGQVPAHDVEVYDEVPQGTRLVGATPAAEQGQAGELVWALGTLKPGEERLLQMRLMPAAEGEIGSVARVYFCAEASVRTVSTRPMLAIDVTAAHEVLIGEKVTVSITVSNPGTGPATGVIIQATLSEGLAHEAGSQLEYELGDLAPNDTRELELTLTAAKAGRFSNQFMVQGDGGLVAEKQADLAILAPELEVSLSGPKRRYLEREGTYTVAVSNPGTASAKEIELATYLPEGLEFVKADNYGEYDPESRVIRWSLEELPPGETGEVTLTALPVTAGEQTLVVEGSAARGLAAKREKTIVIEGVAAIMFEVADVDDPIEVGSETTYEVRVVNQGTKAATDVRLIVLLPDGMEALEADGPVRHTVTAASSEIVFDALPQLAPKADTTFRVRVKGLVPGDQRVIVQVQTKDLRTPVSKEESTHVLSNE